jgi:hypothetical protein
LNGNEKGSENGPFVFDDEFYLLNCIAAIDRIL